MNIAGTIDENEYVNISQSEVLISTGIRLLANTVGIIDADYSHDENGSIERLQREIDHILSKIYEARDSSWEFQS